MNTNYKGQLKEYNNNNGIALISILIAVAFISIIGSALLYITYSNFQMKVMNNRSKTNFYETDGELVDITMTLRNAMDQKSPDNISAYMTSPFQEVTNADGSKSMVGTYDLSTLLGLTSNTVTKDGDTFTYDVSGTIRKAEAGNVTTYTLENIGVKQKSKDGYENTVKTNLELKIHKQTTGGAGKKGLGDCSMICDSQVSVASQYNSGEWTQFGFLTLFGDAYFSNYYYGADGHTFPDFNSDGKHYTMPGDYSKGGKEKAALYLTKDAKINFESEYMAVYGDIVLTGNSCLNISNPNGNLTVYGDIYLLDNSTLVCNGTIYQPKTALPGRGATPCFRSGINQEASAEYLKKHLYYPNGASKTAPRLAEAVEDDSYIEICKLMKLNDEDPKNDGITKKISTSIKYHNGPDNKDYTIDMLQAVNNVPAGTSEGKISTSYYGVPCGVAFANAGAQVGNIDEYQNYILFVTANGQSGKELDLKGSSIGTTMISGCPIYINVQSGVYFSKMGSEIYDFLTVKSNKTDAPYYNPAIHHFELGFSGAKGIDAYGHEGSVNSNMGQGNYYSAGDFLDVDTNTHIQTLFLKGINGGSGGTQYINSASFKAYRKDVD